VDVQPHEVLHIGDDAALDVVGALKAGMQAVWVNRPGNAWPMETQDQHYGVVSDLSQLTRLFQQQHLI
jgi:putative hydrolase of the HAD superfamily